jgi:hypothetical protein
MTVRHQQRNGAEMNKLISGGTKVLLSAVVLASMAFNLIPAGSVFASYSADDTTPPQSTPQSEKKPLDQVFQAEQKAHDHQGELLTKAATASSKISELIARAKGNGKDTTALEKALADFNTKIGEIRLAYDQTGKLIKDHQGFDAAGNVTDQVQALKTVEAVHKGNQDVRQSLIAAVKDLRTAGQEYRKANPRPTLKPNTQPL